MMELHSNHENSSGRVGELVRGGDHQYVIIDNQADPSLFVEEVRDQLGKRTNSVLRYLRPGDEIDIEQVVPVLLVDRTQTADHLKRIGEDIVVRFQGDYTTKRFHRSRFENNDNRIVIEDPGGTIQGIYHVDDRSLLRAPLWNKSTVEESRKELDPVRIQAEVGGN